MGAGASASKEAAPFLAEYFKKLAEKTEQTQEKASAAAMEMLFGGGDTMKQMQKDMVEWYEKEGQPTLKKSFENHDKDKSNALENAEAKVFFLNLIQETDTFTKALAQSMAQSQMKATVTMMAQFMPPKDAKKMEKETKKQIDLQLKAQAKDLDNRVKDYKKNKEERDEAAFKVMDTSEDGKIQLEEFLKTFHPDSSKQAELMVALGFLTEQEMVQQEAMKKMTEGGGIAAMMGGEGEDADCNTQ